MSFLFALRAAKEQRLRGQVRTLACFVSGVNDGR